jgi:hypothetical protein
VTVGRHPANSDNNITAYLHHLAMENTDLVFDSYETYCKVKADGRKYHVEMIVKFETDLLDRMYMERPSVQSIFLCEIVMHPWKLSSQLRFLCCRQLG